MFVRERSEHGLIRVRARVRAIRARVRAIRARVRAIRARVRAIWKLVAGLVCHPQHVLQADVLHELSSNHYHPASSKEVFEATRLRNPHFLGHRQSQRPQKEV